MALLPKAVTALFTAASDASISLCEVVSAVAKDSQPHISGTISESFKTTHMTAKSAATFMETVESHSAKVATSMFEELDETPTPDSVPPNDPTSDPDPVDPK